MRERDLELGLAPVGGPGHGSEAPPAESRPLPGLPDALPILTLMSAVLRETFGNTWASEIQTGEVAVNSIEPTIPFQAASSESETECPSGR